MTWAAIFCSIASTVNRKLTYLYLKYVSYVPFMDYSSAHIYT